MNIDDELDLSMRASYIPINESDDLLLSEDLMWGAFPEGLSLHKEIKALSNNNNNNNINCNKNDSSLAALLCGDSMNIVLTNNTNNILQQQHQQQQQIQPSSHQQNQNHSHHNTSNNNHHHHHQQQQTHSHQQQETRKTNIIDHGSGVSNNNVVERDLVNPNDVLDQVFSKSCKYTFILFVFHLKEFLF